MKKSVFAGVIVLLLATGIVLLHQREAAAYSCSYARGPCGYFTDTNVNANNDVLPFPALRNVRDPNTFINRIQGFLFSGNSWSSTGAAFIVDNMLNYRGVVDRPVGGGVVLGVANARNNFGAWQNLVNSYAYSATPGYGIQWVYQPSLRAFCTPGNNGSAFDTSRNDAALYHIAAYGSSTCSLEYNTSMPEIKFYWPGGAFDIGSLCGNIQDQVNTIPGVPSPNRAPSGTISMSCNGGQQVATITFGDPDAGTVGYVSTGSWSSPWVGAGGPQNITLPPPPTTDPYTPQTITLYVQDSGPFAPPNSWYPFTASTAVPCVTTGCGSLVLTPTPLDQYMRFSLGVSATNNVNQTPPGASFALTITPPAGASYSYNGFQAAGGSGGMSTATFANLGPTNQTGLYGVRWILTAPGISQTCNASMPVVTLPYLSVYGGDVSVGSSPTIAGSATSCSANANAGIFSWNNHTSGYSGAGAQYAVQTLGGIVDFASALGSTNTPPTGLSFANSFTPPDPSKINPSQGLFGGYYGGTSGDCDFTSDLTNAPVTTDTMIGATTVATGVSDVHYVLGADAYISGNIVYAGSGGWATIKDIPNFKLVVTGGDIYIDSTVTQLDGAFIAEPAGGTGGRIFTCASGFRQPVSLGAAGSYAPCNQKLVINGAFVARSVVFGRTYGSLGQASNGDSVASNHAAEVFNYTPELWLPRSASVAGAGYTSITGLPPVL